MERQDSCPEPRSKGARVCYLRFRMWPVAQGVSKVVKQAPQKDGLGLLATLVPAPDDPVAFVEGVTDALQHAVRGR